MAKTLVEKVDSPDLDVTIFKISGTLGFHENQVLTKFFNECSNRGIHKLIMDFSDLGSLGGGCAKIIREAAANGQVRLCIVGASKTVQGFLEKKGPTAILYGCDTSDAISQIKSGATASPAPTVDAPEVDAFAEDGSKNDGPPHAPPSDSTDVKHGDRVDDVIADVDEVLGSTSRPAGRDPERELRHLADDQVEAPVTPPATPPSRPQPATAHSMPPTSPSPAPSSEPTSRQTVSSRSPEDPDRTQPAPEARVAVQERQHDPAPAPVSSAAEPKAPLKDIGANRGQLDKINDLKRRLVQYKWLFSLNADFSAIEDKGQLLDAFLLTTIAQVGVEAAAFLELSGDEFVNQCWKGFETTDPHSLNIPLADVDVGRWSQSPRIFSLADAPLSDLVKQRVDNWDLPHAAPFVVRNQFRGIVLLGRPIRKELDDDAWEFLRMMISQVAIAYENSCRLEKESERTLGLVQSLISMVESNTLSEGTTEFVMDLTYAVAVKMHYPDEHIRDLMYGTVLRDIGMIKTSDLILRSPRELMQEEWEVIKKHPAEGAGMLQKMNFSKHTQDIVMYHHERYNGEGYPSALAGPQIPVGARILSVVESYAAMLQDRPTRPALSREEAIATLEENWGLRYDPEIVDVFIEVIDEEMRTGVRPRYKGIDLIRK